MCAWLRQLSVLATGPAEQPIDQLNPRPAVFVAQQTTSVSEPRLSLGFQLLKANGARAQHQDTKSKRRIKGPLS
jgi:hypothetical protein